MRIRTGYSMAKCYRNFYCTYWNDTDKKKEEEKSHLRDIALSDWNDIKRVISAPKIKFW